MQMFSVCFIIDVLVGRIINNQGRTEELDEEEIEELIKALEEHDEVS